MRVPDTRSGSLFNAVGKLKRQLSVGEVGNIDAIIDLSPKARDMLAELQAEELTYKFTSPSSYPVLKKSPLKRYYQS